MATWWKPGQGRQDLALRPFAAARVAEEKDPSLHGWCSAVFLIPCLVGFRPERRPSLSLNVPSAQTAGRRRHGTSGSVARLVAPEQARGQRALAPLQGEHALLDAAGDDQVVDEDRLGLADAVGAVGGLGLGGRVPPGVVVDDGVGAGQVEAGAARLEADQEDVAAAGWKASTGCWRLLRGAGQHRRRGMPASPQALAISASMLANCENTSTRRPGRALLREQLEQQVVLGRLAARRAPPRPAAGADRSRPGAASSARRGW